MSQLPFKDYSDGEQMSFFAMTGCWVGNEPPTSVKLTAQEKVKDLETKNKELKAEIKRLKEDIASLQRIFSQ